MNKKTIDTIYKWTLRFYYARILIIGISLIGLCLVGLFTDYLYSEHNDFNLFLCIIFGLLGIILFIIGLFRKTETEYGIRNNWHEKDPE